MKRFNPDTKTYKVFNALYQGETLTAAAAKNRWNVGSLSAEVTRIRQAGYAVYAKSRTAGNHVKVTEYQLGQPSRRLVAAGYRAIQLGLA